MPPAPQTIHYRVFLNDTPGSRFMELVHGAYLRLAYAAQLQVGKSDDDLTLLNRIYELFNIKHPTDYLNRSLSVADVVTIFPRRADCSYVEPHSYVVQYVGYFHLDVVILTDCLYGGKSIDPLKATRRSAQRVAPAHT